MANEIISSDIYDINRYVNNIMRKHVDIDDETHYAGLFGYLNEVHSLLLQNQIIASAELANEAIPIMAKYDKSVITHAASLGVNNINATPSLFNVIIMLSEEQIVENMHDGTFIHDTSVPIYVGDYEFHTPYDIIITQSTLATGDTVYTARYDMTIPNPIAEIDNPYLDAPVKMNMNGTNYLMLNVGLRQIEMDNSTEDKVITSNAIESKMFTFEFEGQLADFSIDVIEGDELYHLIPYYEGTIVKDSTALYCYYSYLNATTIRVKFVEESYYPKINCDININIVTTQGSDGVFKYNQDIIMTAESNKYNYSNIDMLIRPIDGESIEGYDKKTIDDLKKIIPIEALSRGSVTNTLDLTNFFNQLDNVSSNGTTCKMYFFRKRDNQLERLYYSYLVLKDEFGIMPTNTLNMHIYIQDFISSSDIKYVINPGTPIFLDKGKDTAVIATDISNIEGEGGNSFLYTTPFMIVVNSRPLSISYYLNILNKRYNPDYVFINHDSVLQFILGTISWTRPFTYDRNKYTMTINLTQNITEDEGLLVKNEVGDIVETNIRAIALVYTSDDGNPHRWMEGTLVNYDEETYTFTFKFTCTTNDVLDNDNNIRIEDMKDIGSEDSSYGFFKANCACKIAVLVKQPEENGRDILDSYIPNLEGWTLSNMYDVKNGIDFFINYSHIVTSSITSILENQEELLPDLGADTYLIKKKVIPNSVIRILDVKDEDSTTAYYGYSTVDFNRDTDMMEVYLDGVKLAEYVDFVIDEANDRIKALNPEGWKLDEGNPDMTFEFLILKNSIVTTDSSIRYKFEMTRNGFYVRESTDTVDFIGGTITNYDPGRDTLELYINGLKYCEGTDYTVENTTVKKISGQWIVDEEEPKNFFEFIKIKNNKYEETDESTAIVVGAIGDSSFRLGSVPLVKYGYIVDNEDSCNRFINQLERRRTYTDMGILRLENQFGVDIKFVNTYGPSRAFFIDEGININRVNLTMNFRMKLETSSDKYIKEYIIDYIKDYIEDISSINDLHIPNLITSITNQYREQLIYFEFLGFNEYGPGYQHIYQNEDVEYGMVVPEFLNIYTVDAVPSINIAVV